MGRPKQTQFVSKDAISPPHPKLTKVYGKNKADIKTADKELPPPTKEMGSSSAALVCLSSAQATRSFHMVPHCPVQSTNRRVAAPGVSSAMVKFCVCQQMYTRWAKCCSQIPNICAPHMRGWQLSLPCPLLCHNWVSKATLQIAQCHSNTFEIH